MKSAGATFNDTVVVYDTIKDVFLIDSNKFFYGATVFNSNYYAISNIEAKVYQDEYGQTDDDSPTPFVYWTKEFAMGDPTMRKILREVRTFLDMNELATLTQEIWVD